VKQDIDALRKCGQGDGTRKDVEEDGLPAGEGKESHPLQSDCVP